MKKEISQAEKSQITQAEPSPSGWRRVTPHASGKGYREGLPPKKKAQ